MQVARRRARVRPGSSNVDTRKFPHRVQLYTVPPTDEITLEEFESFGYDRLKGVVGKTCVELQAEWHALAIKLEK